MLAPEPEVCNYLEENGEKNWKRQTNAGKRETANRKVIVDVDAAVETGKVLMGKLQ